MVRSNEQFPARICYEFLALKDELLAKKNKFSVAKFRLVVSVYNKLLTF